MKISKVASSILFSVAVSSNAFANWDEWSWDSYESDLKIREFISSTISQKDNYSKVLNSLTNGIKTPLAKV